MCVCATSRFFPDVSECFELMWYTSPCLDVYVLPHTSHAIANSSTLCVCVCVCVGESERECERQSEKRVGESVE